MNPQKVIVKHYGSQRTIWVCAAMVDDCGVSKTRQQQARSHYASTVPASRRCRQLQPDTGAAWRYATMNDTVYYDYSRLPKGVCGQLPAEKELLDMARQPYTTTELQNQLDGRIEADAVADYGRERLMELMHYYMYDTAGRFTPTMAYQMARGYVVLRYVWQIRTDRRYLRYGMQRLKDFDAAVIASFSENHYPNLNIGGSRQLRSKLAKLEIMERRQQGRDIVVSGKYGNRHAAKVQNLPVVDTDTGEVAPLSLHELVMYGLWNGGGAQAGILNKERKCELYKQYCTEMSRYGYADRTISLTSFCNYTNRWTTKLFLSIGRDGRTMHNNEHRPYILTKGVEHPMSLWVADGTGTKMVFQYRGVMRTLYRVNIFDVASQYIVGYSINTNIRNKNVDKEEAQMMIDSVRMAIGQTGGRVANELLTDNGGAFAKAEVKDMCRQLFPVYRTINPGNSQENQAETLQRLVFNFCRRYTNFVGSRLGVRNKENQTTNFDGLDIQALPTFEQAVAQQNEMVEAWNNQRGSDGLTPRERFFGTDNENMSRTDWGVKLNEHAIRRATGMYNRCHLAWQRGKMQLQYAGTDYTYELDLARNADALNQRTGQHGNVEVDVWHDGLKADLYTTNGALICTVSAVQKAYKAQCEKVDASVQGMTEQMRIRADFDRRVADNAELIGEMRWRLPLSGEVTDYGFAVAGKSKVKPELQDCEEILLNEAAETEPEPEHESEPAEVGVSPEMQALEDF